MSTLTHFNAHYVNAYNAYWNSISAARLILLNIATESLTPTTSLAIVTGAEIAAGNGYTTGGAAIPPHTSTYDVAQARAEGRPPAVTFTANGGNITFNAYAIIATRGGVDELVSYYHYGSTQTISGPSNSREITVALNLGGPTADVVAPD